MKKGETKDFWTIGMYLKALRLENECRAEQVYKGLCSAATYHRYEGMERIPNKFLFDSFLQRLGSSTDWFEAVLTKKEYQLIECRDDLLYEVSMRHRQQAEILLMKCRAMESEPKILQQQLLMMIEGIFLYWDEKPEQAEERFRMAYQLTGGEGQYTRQEYTLLLLLHHIHYQQGRQDDIIEQLLEFCHRSVTDSREKARVYPRAVYYRLLELQEKQQFQELIDLGIETVELMGHEGEISYTQEILELLVTAYQQVGNHEEGQKRQHQRDAIKDAMEEIQPDPMLGLEKLVFYGNRGECFLVSEYFVSMRKTMNLSQEQMEEVCSEREYRRIESGAITPSRQTMQRLAKFANCEKDFFTGYRSVPSVEAFQRKKEMNYYLHHNKLKKAEEILRKDARALKNTEYMTVREQQGMQGNNILMKVRNKELPAKEGIGQMTELIKLTQPTFSLETLSGLYLNMTETAQINRLASFYDECGDKKTAIEIWTNTIRSYQRSETELRYHIVAMGIIMGNLEMKLEEVDQFRAALDMCDRQLALLARCGKLTDMGCVFMDKAYTMNRMSNINEQYRKIIVNYYKRSYYLAEFMENEYMMGVTSDILQKEFDVIM